jgi:hypothetical protein
MMDAAMGDGSPEGLRYAMVSMAPSAPSRERHIDQ